MKGDWPGFAAPAHGSTLESQGKYINGKDYNPAGSTYVKQVDTIQTVSNKHTTPLSNTPNSVIRKYKAGRLDSERYYGSDGKPYLDIDYSDHGNPKMHPRVPHQHTITFVNGHMKRAKTDGGIK